MSCTDFEPFLDDYLDGELDDARRAGIELHVEGCPACGESLEERRRLDRAVGALPRGLAPSRDLLPGIRHATVGRSRKAFFWIGVAASLIVLSSATWLVVRSIDPRHETRTITRGITVPDLAEPWSVGRVNQIEFELAEEEYEQATARLLQTLDERKNSMSPQTRELVEENLRIIDQAIDELRDALETAPEDPANGHALNSLYRQKVEFLWRLSRLSS